MSKPVGFALIGCGDIAQSGHLPALVRHPGAQLIAVADIVVDQARRVGTQYNVRAFDSHHEAIAQPGVEAIVVATPPEMTPGITLDAIAAGKDVLCEKPMAVHLEDAEKVDAAAQTAGRIVQVGFKNRFSPLVRTLRRWLEEGRLGMPLVFTIGAYGERYDPTDQRHYHRITHFLSHGPAIVHEGAHTADYLRFLSDGCPAQVMAVGLRSRPEYPSENFSAAVISFDNGDVARIEVGWLFSYVPQSELDRDIRVWGPEGVGELNRPERWVQLRTGAGIVREEMSEEWNPACFDAQLTHFLECVAQRRQPETGTKAGIASMQLTLAVVESMRAGQPVTLSVRDIHVHERRER